MAVGSMCIFPLKFKSDAANMPDVSQVEEKIRNAILVRRSRTGEYLKDFDRLRTGFITKAQFDRCLDQHYGIVLSTPEETVLMQKYGSHPDHLGMVNYRSFCQNIDQAFGKSSCAVRVTEPLNDMKIRTLSPTSLEKCSSLLERIAPYYRYHGINIESCYEDFDQHNIGLVTESQFYRRFPGPPDITPQEQSLLAKRYMDTARHGLCRYMDFHHDIEKRKNVTDKRTENTYEPKYQENSNKEVKEEPTIQRVFDKIRIAVHKNGIRTTEFFKDHDKLRSGVITRNQFVCGITLCCGMQANLSHEEIDLLVKFYQTDDGRVRYKEFCHLMENAFNVPDLEKKPTVDVFRPPIGALAKMPNKLATQDEERIQYILHNLRQTVRKKRVMLYPYFKDFDRGNCYTRGITKTQFSRMLHMVGLNVQQAELELLSRKFEYPASGDINYPAFVQAIDSEYCGKAPVTGEWNTTNFPSTSIDEDRSEDLSEEEVDELIKRIRHDVLINRIRVEEFFQDFDPLRHGSISTSRFRMGLSALNNLHLSEHQICAIVKRYADPKKEYNVLWTKFLTDIEKVFTQRGLEKNPTLVLPPVEVFHIARSGAIDWESQPSEKKEKFKEVMHKMKQKVKQRRILTKSFFQDFDRHNNGYVTKSQMRQCMAYLCFDCTTDESNIVYEKFRDNTGFNYIKFLEELEPLEKQELKYEKRLKEMKSANKLKVVEKEKPDIAAVMYKIKSKVVKEAVRVYEFMKDYDKLRTGRMLRTSFPRALDLCNLGLNEAEILTVMEWYTSPTHPDYVDYYQFCDDVESALTIKGLEKNPTLVPTQFKPNMDYYNVKLTPEAEELFETVMHRLADRVRIRRIQLFPLFEDYDRVHNGTCSRSQFHRVLSELELGSLVSQREFHVLYQKFDSVIGGKHDFNYIQFCEKLNDYAHFDPNVP